MESGCRRKQQGVGAVQRALLGRWNSAAVGRLTAGALIDPCISDSTGRSSKEVYSVTSGCVDGWKVVAGTAAGRVEVLRHGDGTAWRAVECSWGQGAVIKATIGPPHSQVEGWVWCAAGYACRGVQQRCRTAACSLQMPVLGIEGLGGRAVAGCCCHCSDATVTGPAGVCVCACEAWPQGTCGGQRAAAGDCWLDCTADAACTAAGCDWLAGASGHASGWTCRQGPLLSCLDMCFDLAGATLAWFDCTSCSSGQALQGCVCTSLL